jgi:glyoxylase-like metal-dependent hydrolase (beta-lactamase superfamily II)
MNVSSSEPGEIKFFETSAGGRIYQIPIQMFPILWGYAYLVFVKDGLQEYRVLIDSGSGFGDSNQHLEAGIEAVAAYEGPSCGLDKLTHVFITHGHIDPFGGLTYVRPRTQAKVGVHELDLRNLTNYEERLTVVARRLDGFLVEAGVPPEKRDRLIDMYMITKSLYHSVNVDFTFGSMDMKIGPFDMLHVPGHCAGQVAIRLHDILFSGDHVLNEISPHQSPERLTLSTGLNHYLNSLELIRGWTEGVNLTLGGHKTPIIDLQTRLDALRELHQSRLAQILDILVEPLTIVEISQAVFGKVHGYNILLALEEAGAHIEYLYQHGLLGIANIAELENGTGPVPIQYYRLDEELSNRNVY